MNLLKSSLTILSNKIIDSIFDTMNCIRVGKIVTFNSKNDLTAEVQIQDKWQRQDGTLVDFPLLVDVPCIQFSGNSGGIDVPINEGDTGILLFNDRNIDKWWSTNTVQSTSVYRCHSFNDAIFIVGIRSLKNLISGYSANATRVWHGSNSMTMGSALTTFNNPIQAAYKSLDGSTGLTTTQTIEVGGNVVKTMTIKNGLIVSIQ